MMQTRQLSAPYYQHFYPNFQSMNHTAPDHYPATHYSLNLGGFSRGSSMNCADHEYPYLPECGGPSTRPTSSRLPQPSPNATGMEITGHIQGIQYFRGAHIPSSQQPWQWTSASAHGQVAPLTACPGADQLHLKTIVDPPILRSPAAQLPTPAAMAVLLNPTARSEVPTPLLPPPPANEARQTANTRPSRLPETVSDIGVQSMVDTHSREKRHGCWMCHKSFDRPSTLRKHLLVHTGEKAFVCETCGRRFGVASNLNRHVRKCILKPVNTVAVAASSEVSASPTTSSATATSLTPSTSASSSNLQHNGDHVPISKGKNKRARESPLSSSSSPTSSHSYNQHCQQTQTRPKEPVPKRRRRAPSPSQWIPFSLLTFNLSSDEFHKSAPVPLPPVTPSMTEERNSWDENVAVAPYHPSGWNEKLPGPGLGLGLGLGGRDMGNLNLGGSGGFMLGRVVVS